MDTFVVREEDDARPKIRLDDFKKNWGHSVLQSNSVGLHEGWSGALSPKMSIGPSLEKYALLRD